MEATRVAAIQAVATDHWLRDAPGAPVGIAGVLATRSNGRCVFYRGPAGCTVHHTLGHAALPSSCQHFPRECLIDPRGVSVTLSHYCPTAADLLFADSGPGAIVAGPPAIAGGEAEGLDARDVLPPLLTDGVLTDHAGYAAWEAHMIRTLAGEEAQRSARAPGWGDHHVVIARFVAAHAFASWMAYQGNGLSSVIRRLRTALAVLRVEAVRACINADRRLTRSRLKHSLRRADLLLVHLVDREELAPRLSASPA